MSARFVIVVEGGLVLDVYSDSETDFDVLIVDYDAHEFGDEDDERVTTLDGQSVWVTGYPPVVDPWYVSKVLVVAVADGWFGFAVAPPFKPVGRPRLVWRPQAARRWSEGRTHTRHP